MVRVETLEFHRRPAPLQPSGLFGALMGENPMSLSMMSYVYPVVQPYPGLEKEGEVKKARLIVAKKSAAG
ncbi:hypothetical protein GCM10027443_38150 [Pontibacter brevis]